MWSAIRVERLTSDRFGSGSKEDSISLKQCWTSGTAQRASSIRFAPTTGISTSLDNRHRHPMARGIWSRSGREGRNLNTPLVRGKRTKGSEELSEPSNPDLAAIEREIQSADDHARNYQNGCRDVRIDELIQVMEEEPALVRLNSGLAFEPVLQHGQRTRPRQ